MKKAQAEQMLASYDADPISALTAALQISLDMPNAAWAQLLAAAPIDNGRRQRLNSGDQVTLDRLVAELNERRGFDDR